MTFVAPPSGVIDRVAERLGVPRERIQAFVDRKLAGEAVYANNFNAENPITYVLDDVARALDSER